MTIGKVPRGLIGLNICRIRKSAHLTQAALAGRAGGVSIATLKNLERGTNINPGLDTLERLSRALGVSLAELLKEPRKRRA